MCNGALCTFACNHHSTRLTVRLPQAARERVIMFLPGRATLLQ
jgi:hypothetical protein